MVAACLMLLVVAALGTMLFSASAPSSAATATITYDTSAYTYDASSGLSTQDAAASPRGSPATLTAASREDSVSLGRFGVAAKSVPGAADDIAVIGRQWDTAVAKDWPGHEVLDIPKWSPAKNDAWVNGIIERQQRVYIASPETKANLWDAVNNRTTVFGRELGQLFDAGYMRSGDYLLPPG